MGLDKLSDAVIVYRGGVKEWLPGEEVTAGTHIHITKAFAPVPALLHCMYLNGMAHYASIALLLSETHTRAVTLQYRRLMELRRRGGKDKPKVIFIVLI